MEVDCYPRDSHWNPHESRLSQQAPEGWNGGVDKAAPKSTPVDPEAADADSPAARAEELKKSGHDPHGYRLRKALCVVNVNATACFGQASCTILHDRHHGDHIGDDCDTICLDPQNPTPLCEGLRITDLNGDGRCNWEDCQGEPCWALNRAFPLTCVLNINTCVDACAHHHAYQFFRNRNTGVETVCINGTSWNIGSRFPSLVDVTDRGTCQCQPDPTCLPPVTPTSAPTTLAPTPATPPVNATCEQLLLECNWIQALTQGCPPTWKVWGERLCDGCAPTQSALSNSNCAIAYGAGLGTGPVGTASLTSSNVIGYTHSNPVVITGVSTSTTGPLDADDCIGGTIDIIAATTNGFDTPNFQNLITTTVLTLYSSSAHVFDMSTVHSTFRSADTGNFNTPQILPPGLITVGYSNALTGCTKKKKGEPLPTKGKVITMPDGTKRTINSDGVITNYDIQLWGYYIPESCVPVTKRDVHGAAAAHKGGAPAVNHPVAASGVHKDAAARPAAPAHPKKSVPNHK
jgi:hypothetical protein